MIIVSFEKSIRVKGSVCLGDVVCIKEIRLEEP